MKNILSQMGGGVKISFMNPWGVGGHKYDFHFLFWHQNALASGGLCPPPQTPSPIIIFFIFHTPLFTTTTEKNGNMKRYAYTEMPSVRFFYDSAHRHLIIRKYRHFIKCILFPTSVIRKVNLQHPHPTRNVIVPCQEIESYRYIMFKNLSYHIRLYCTLCLFLFVRSERK